MLGGAHYVQPPAKYKRVIGTTAIAANIDLREGSASVPKGFVCVGLYNGGDATTLAVNMSGDATMTESELLAVGGGAFVAGFFRTIFQANTAAGAQNVYAVLQPSGNPR